MANKSDKDANIRVGRLLQSARESRQITQIEIATATGMSKNQISAVECGNSKASVDLLLGYCRKLDMTPNELLGFTEKEMLSDLKSFIETLEMPEQQRVYEILKLIYRHS